MFTNLSTRNKRNGIFEDGGLKIHKAVKERCIYEKALSIWVISKSDNSRNEEYQNAENWQDYWR